MHPKCLRADRCQCLTYRAPPSTWVLSRELNNWALTGAGRYFRSSGVYFFEGKTRLVKPLRARVEGVDHASEVMFHLVLP